MAGESKPIFASVPFEVVYDRLFEEEFAKIDPDPLTRDDRLVSIEFIVARIPTSLSHVHIGQLKLYRLIHDGNPAVRIWYTFDGNTVRMRLIEELP